MDSKPWLCAPVHDRMWARSSNHRGKKVKPSQIDAIVLLQDGNMAGSYVRVIQWCPAIDGKTRFAIYTPNKQETSHQGWYFEEQVENMAVGDIVHNKLDGTAFIVRPNYMGKYVKVLERVAVE